MTDELLVYGSYGFTGDLIVRNAVAKGLTPVLAGRNAKRVERQATELGLEHRVFSLEHPGVIESRIDDVAAVLNCAGPFSATVDPLLSACLSTGTDYLDIAAEFEVLEAIAERDREAEGEDVTLITALGFNAASDCLAAHLHDRLPSAEALALAVDHAGNVSPGTARSLIEGLSRPGAIRRDGRLHDVPVAWKTRRIDFGDGPQTAVTIPWGDVSTAYYTTGIPNVETYAAVPEPLIGLMRRTRPLVSALGLDPVQRLMKAGADLVVSEPSATDRAATTIRIWGEVSDNARNANREPGSSSGREGSSSDERERAVARMRTPDSYDLTSQTAVEAARRTLSGEVPAGFHTPASAFGSDFVVEFEGVEWIDKGKITGAETSAGR